MNQSLYNHVCKQRPVQIYAKRMEILAFSIAELATHSVEFIELLRHLESYLDFFSMIPWYNWKERVKFVSTKKNHKSRISTSNRGQCLLAFLTSPQNATKSFLLESNIVWVLNRVDQSFWLRTQFSIILDIIIITIESSCSTRKPGCLHQKIPMMPLMTQ